MNSGIVFGIIVLSLGALIIALTIKGKSKNNLITYIIGGYCVFLAIMIFYMTYIDNFKFMFHTMFLPFSVLVLILYLQSLYIVIFFTKKIDAVYYGKAFIASVKGRIVYYPSFNININGQSEEIDCVDEYTLKKLEKTFTQGKHYILFYNEKLSYYKTKLFANISMHALIIFSMISLLITSIKVIFNL